VIYMGVDPGVGGAIATWDPEMKALWVTDMPTHTVTINRKKRPRLDLYQFTRIMDMWPGITRAYIEDPHAMPGQGATSSFSFGFACGAAQMAVAAHMIPMTLFQPNMWKRLLRLTDDKDASRRRASQELPKFSHYWERKQDDGRAEAALLAVYGPQLQQRI
jgi:crossover junction endodeoxyribonuclease RuvC